MNKLKSSLPFILFLLVMIVLWRGLGLRPALVPSPLINHAVPLTHLPTLFDPKKIVTEQDFLHHITLLHVWATWCNTCLVEHAYWIELARNNPKIKLYGYIYKDNPGAVKAWLAKNGNPYQVIALDESGHNSIDWGIYGTPETYIIDRYGIIRDKIIGPMTPHIWATTVKPLIEALP